MRQALCHRYSDCLNLAAMLGKEFDCDSCLSRDSYQRQESDLFGVYLLLAVFKPDEYKTFVRADRREYYVAKM